MHSAKKSNQPRSTFENRTIAVNQNATTPHQKTLSGRIGVQKAAGMGKVKKIGVKKGK
jgi:hypothetical protein